MDAVDRGYLTGGGGGGGELVSSSGSTAVSINRDVISNVITGWSRWQWMELVLVVLVVPVMGNRWL